MEHSKRASRILVSVFFLALFGATLISVFAPRRAYSELEKRTLRSLPALTLESLTTRDDAKKFSTNYETYVADQFLCRDQLVGVKSTSEYLLGKKDANGVYLGKNGYLFSNSKDDSAFTGNLGYAAQFLYLIQDRFHPEHTALMLVPDSAELYPELLPDFAETMDTQALYNSARAQLAQVDNVFLSPLDLLTEHKDEEIYYRTDHHWTTRGAYYGYEALSRAFGFTHNKLFEYRETCVSDDFYGTYAAKINLPLIKPDRILRYDLIRKVTPVMKMQSKTESYPSIYFEDALDTADQYNYFLGNNQAYLSIETGASNGKTLVLIKDSYAHSMIPYLADHYEKIICVDLRYYEDSVLDLISEFHSPIDVLILYQTQNFATDNSIFKLCIPEQG